MIACENIRFSSLFAAVDISRGGTSATQRQKFHTEDVCQKRIFEHRQIIVDWQSPVGFRSLKGNCFFSSDDMMWNRIKRFIMRIFILPVMFFLPALFVEYLQYNNIFPRYNFLHISHLFSSVKVLCYCCYYLQALLCSFSVRKPEVWSLSNCRRPSTDPQPSITNVNSLSDNYLVPTNIDIVRAWFLFLCVNRNEGILEGSFISFF